MIKGSFKGSILVSKTAEEKGKPKVDLEKLYKWTKGSFKDKATNKIL